MLDYKVIINKHYGLGMSGTAIAHDSGVSKSGVNDFLRAFERCEKLSYPLPEGITNYAIYEMVYGKTPGTNGRDLSFELPDFAEISRAMTKKNMTLVFQWDKYAEKCQQDGHKYYQYRQFCERYSRWCEENQETLHFDAVIGQTMEVDFAGQTFWMIDSLTGEAIQIVVFVAVLPYSQYIYAEGMLSTKEPQWIDVNNHALEYFGGVPAIVVCDNCKQAVTANKDWIAPELNQDYAEWAEHNHTVILPAKVRHPKFKPSVEGAVGILEKGIFHKLEDRQYFSLDAFNQDLWEQLKDLNRAPFKKREHSRFYFWQEEQMELMPLPEVPYTYMERAEAKVSSDFHVRFDNAYYSVDKAYLHKTVRIRASVDKVYIYAQDGRLIYTWPRATAKGQWSTDPKHLPSNYSGYAEWNGPYFTRKAMLVGPNTTAVIQRILASRKLEVQTYRICLGILNFSKKYSKQALEMCCEKALACSHVTYTYIKNTIAAVAEELGASGYNTKVNEEKNKGGFVMNPDAMDLSKLLNRSQALAQRKERDDT